jgi:hypothetical protein
MSPKLNFQFFPKFSIFLGFKEKAMEEIKRRSIGRKKHEWKNDIPDFCIFVFIGNAPFVINLYYKIDKNEIE